MAWIEPVPKGPREKDRKWKKFRCGSGTIRSQPDFSSFLTLAALPLVKKIFSRLGLFGLPPAFAPNGTIMGGNYSERPSGDFQSRPVTSSNVQSRFNPTARRIKSPSQLDQKPLRRASTPKILEPEHTNGLRQLALGEPTGQSVSDSS